MENKEQTVVRLTKEQALHNIYCRPDYFVDYDNVKIYTDRIRSYLSVMNQVYDVLWGLVDYDDLASEIADEIYRDVFDHDTL